MRTLICTRALTEAGCVALWDLRFLEVEEGLCLLVCSVSSCVLSCVSVLGPKEEKDAMVVLDEVRKVGSIFGTRTEAE